MIMGLDYCLRICSTSCHMVRAVAFHDSSHWPALHPTCYSSPPCYVLAVSIRLKSQLKPFDWIHAVMALRKLVFKSPMRTALRSGQRALLSYSGGPKVTGGVAAASGVTAAAHELTGAFPSNLATTKFGDPSFWEGQYSSQVCVCFHPCAV